MDYPFSKVKTGRGFYFVHFAHNFMIYPNTTFSVLKFIYMFLLSSKNIQS